MYVYVHTITIGHMIYAMRLVGDHLSILEFLARVYS